MRAISDVETCLASFSVAAVRVFSMLGDMTRPFLLADVDSIVYPTAR